MLKSYDDRISNVMICHVYYVEGLGHNLFSVGQFCDDDLEVAFLFKICYVRNLEGDNLLMSAHDSNLYTIAISDISASSIICLMSKVTSTKSWLCHRRLSHLNFGTINHLTKQELFDVLLKFKYDKDHLCSACEQGKIKKAIVKLKLVPSTDSKLELLHLDLCEPIRVESINGKKYILFDELMAMASEHNYLEPESNRFIVKDWLAESTKTPSKEDLDDLFGPLYEEDYKSRQPEVFTNSVAPTTLNNEDTPSSSTIIVDDNEAPLILFTFEEPTYPISNDLADELNQEENTEVDGNTFITPFCPLVIEEAESSSTNQDLSNMHEFNQLHPLTHTWTKAHPLKQAIGDHSKPKTMQDHSCIESMQDELHQFERLNVWEFIARLAGKNIIGLKLLWKNKTDVENTVIKNKSRLVAKGYHHEEVINFEESFALIARIEVV
ncbi:integrase, catalytic region, zinc finger, CCHC-type containing protein [Tanacetum coccineum]|uniref:Integrase, catalytic region, zinc finger, CCHC-type containing protein n=1 Tax=Tanacetum coccineum TaxID=301880 RepID=A0ABQ5IES4_9ASTR